MGNETIMKGLYRLANRNIAITSLYPAVHDLCKDYRIEGATDFSVEISLADIDHERVQSAREAAREGRSPRPVSNGYLETLAVYRKIAEQMPAYDTVLFHGSCIAVDGVAYLFAAPSGTGKSTHARLWRALLGDRARMVNDDKPLLQLGADGVTVFGTPWNGKHRLGENISAPLKAICLLERSPQNRIRSATRAEVLPLLLQQTYRPVDPEALSRTLFLVDELSRRVKLFRLGCNMDPEAAQVAYDAMKGGCAMPDTVKLRYEDILDREGKLTYTNVGVSMLPLLRQGRDLFTVTKKGPDRCKVGDVILYRRPPKAYVLHRIVQVLPDSYVLLGDNCICREYGIREEDVLGVMTGFVRNGKAHSVQELGYRAYTGLILFTTPLRILIKKLLLRLRRHLRKA